MTKIMVTMKMMIVAQIAALKWLQQNIKHFGGNPELVTLFGYRYVPIVIIVIILNCPQLSLPSTSSIVIIIITLFEYR